MLGFATVATDKKCWSCDAKTFSFRQSLQKQQSQTLRNDFILSHFEPFRMKKLKDTFMCVWSQQEICLLNQRGALIHMICPKMRKPEGAWKTWNPASGSKFFSSQIWGIIIRNIYVTYVFMLKSKYWSIHHYLIFKKSVVSVTESSVGRAPL